MNEAIKEREYILKQAKEAPGIFIEFPVPTENGYERITVLNPNISDEIKDVIIRIVTGDELTDIMLHNRAVFEKAFRKLQNE